MSYLNDLLEVLIFSPAFGNWAGEAAQKNISRWRQDKDAVLGESLLTDIEIMIGQCNTGSGRQSAPGGKVRLGLHSHRTVENMDGEIRFGGSAQQDAQDFTNLVFFCLQRLDQLCTPNKKCKKTESKGLTGRHDLRNYTRDTKMCGL